MATPTSDEKTTSIITYFTVFGLIIGLIMNHSKKSEFVSYHIRNMIGLCLGMVALGILHWVGIPSMLIKGLQLVLVILWTIGFIGALKGERLEIPVVGKFFQDSFKSI
ncbi:hypothetical protein GCM10011344_44030 [Dokdonia pacifica]|uniref:Uncharacterized membrane protein n=1 Tax=Dokdonia pacifica TaxID=1627892 RepID=A0A239CIV4_9FLAO|nr:hypothetical protein [Dokdonia pacifica]GGG38364.1 hypothetical protein GCM10011344_44030 [Dokdonia pacifica]SNS20097.1 Uncharacterized membrane protein [Dokdonia pacifica]